MLNWMNRSRPILRQAALFIVCLIVQAALVVWLFGKPEGNQETFSMFYQRQNGLARDRRLSYINLTENNEVSDLNRTQQQNSSNIRSIRKRLQPANGQPKNRPQPYLPLGLSMYKSQPVFSEKDKHHTVNLTLNNESVIIAPSVKEYCSKGACLAETKKLIILIPSSITNIQRRQFLRGTWANNTEVSVIGGYHVLCLFLVGTIKGDTVSDEKLSLEAEDYKDILQVNSIEHYHKLVEKEVVGWNWVNQNCLFCKATNSFIAKADDDMFVNVFAAVEMLNKYSAFDLSASIFGEIFDFKRPHRLHKTDLTIAEYPYSTYPRYARGGFYMLSAKLTPVMLKRALVVRYIRVEDAFITGIIMQSLNITYYSFHKFGISFDGNYSKLRKSNQMFVHTTDEYVKTKLWVYARQLYHQNKTQFYNV